MDDGGRRQSANKSAASSVIAPVTNLGHVAVRDIHLHVDASVGDAATFALSIPLVPCGGPFCDLDLVHISAKYLWNDLTICRTKRMPERRSSPVALHTPCTAPRTSKMDLGELLLQFSFAFNTTPAARSTAFLTGKVNVTWAARSSYPKSNAGQRSKPPTQAHMFFIRTRELEFLRLLPLPTFSGLKALVLRR